MLYLRWLETSGHHADRTAIVDGGREISFGELAAMVEEAPLYTGPVTARTGGIGFFVSILSAWKQGLAVIPVEHGAPAPRLKSVVPEGTHLVKYTPGGCGIPRAIFFDEKQVIADGDRLYGALGLDPLVPSLAVISLAHSYGFSNIVLQMILHGVPVLLAPVPFPRVVEEVCARHGPVVVSAVPSIWKAWHRAGILESLPVSLAVSAGAPLSLSLEQQVYETSGLKIHNLYGASECGAISYDATPAPRERQEQVGSVLPGVCVSVERSGRLLVESDAVGIGYDETRADDLFGEGRYLSRDQGEVDERGRVLLYGNTGGAINVSGRKISPAKVEAALMETGHLLRVRVIGVPSRDPERFEEIFALYTAKPGVTVEALKSAVMQRLELWELPRHWYDDPALWELDPAGLRAKWKNQ